jgi:GNAT superfamily N-acetyltransferase
MTQAAPRPSDVTIAPVGPADIEDALSLLRAQLDEHEIPVSDSELRRSIDELFVRPHLGVVLLARAQPGEALGLAFVNFAWTPEIGGMAGWLDELYVRPEHRGAGLGTRLLQAAIALCREQGCRAVDLQVEPSHSRAADLYARSGFQELPRRTFRLDLRRSDGNG